MESNNKLRKGLTKAKQAMSFHRTSSNKSNSSTTQIIPDQPKQNIASSSTASVGFVIPDIINNGRDSYWKFESLYGVGAGDESVDMKAAAYISCVQERFRLSV